MADNRDLLSPAGIFSGPPDLSERVKETFGEVIEGKLEMNLPSPSEPITLGHGYYWQDIRVGQKFRTFRRTITESDLVNFIGTTGMLEAIFIEVGYEHAAMKGRAVHGALTYALIEGFILQSMIQGTGLAMLELHKKILAPVVVGDTVHAEIEVTAIRPTSKNNRAIVTSKIDVYNQRSEMVMTYEATRMLAGRPDGV
jgi:3-hydroxybutyryl-CoA dehydratase